MTSIARTTRQRAQRRRPCPETAYLLRSDANAAHLAASIAQLRALCRVGTKDTVTVYCGTLNPIRR
jgi:hypothetical protein